VTLPALTWLSLLVFTARDHLLLGAGALLSGPALYLLTRRLRR